MASQSPQWIATARVMRRAGFGATGPQIDTVDAAGVSNFVEAALDADPHTDPGVTATPMPTPVKLPPRGKNLSAAERKARNRDVDKQLTELSNWWLRRMVAVRQPLPEKLTLLWHNHFATSAAKVRSPATMAAQNSTLRSLSLGDFRTLAYSMLTDAAMIHWLDAQTSTAKAPNENLAREFMELFALGHGNGYTEDDVRQGARALTGWVVRPAGHTTMVAKRHDHSPKTLFGNTRNFDAAGFCDVVLAQPKSAEYVCGRLWQQLASDSPPSSPLLQRLTTAYGPTRDLRSLTRAILTDDEFVSGRASIVNTPVEWLIGMVRTLQIAVDAPNRITLVDKTLRSLGQRPFYPPDVGGWPHGRVWMSTASANERIDAAVQLARIGDISTIEDAATGDRIDAVGYLIGVGDFCDSTVAALKPLVGKPVDLVAAAVNTPEYLTS